jgi:uncharacterized membrane protein
LIVGLIVVGLAFNNMGTVHPDFRPLHFDTLSYALGLLGLTGMILILLPNRVFGRFSKKGIETHNRIMAFRKFITDYSSLKRYPPSSLAIWDEIIVYATALGCADNVEKHMKKIVGANASTPISRAARIGITSRISSGVRSSSSSGGRGGGRAGGGGRGAR